MASILAKLPDELQLATAAHVKYVQALDTRRGDYDYWLTEHLRLNGLYWGLTACHLLGRPDALPRQETIDFVLSCQHMSGGFGAAPGHDAHMLSTASAVQVLAMVGALDELDRRGKGGGRKGVANCEQHRRSPGLRSFLSANTQQLIRPALPLRPPSHRQSPKRQDRHLRGR